jgi:hypothetical protein
MVDYFGDRPGEKLRQFSKLWYALGVPVVAVVYGVFTFLIMLTMVGQLNPDARPMSASAFVFVEMSWDVVRFPLFYVAESQWGQAFFRSVGISYHPDITVLLPNGIVWGFAIVGIWHLLFLRRRRQK